VTKVSEPARASKAARKHDPASWHCNCKRCRREVDRLFDGDRAFFNANPGRRLYCREFIEGEFPSEMVGDLPAGRRRVVIVHKIASGLRIRRVCTMDETSTLPATDAAIAALFGTALS